MAMYKEQALGAHGIESIYDVYNDAYRLRRIAPAEYLQVHVTREEFEHRSVNEIYNIFDSYAREQDDFVHLGPTNKELRDPRIKHAWEDLQIIRRLIGTI
jgi:hypothetical protein